jgi:hypothetical protein
MEFKICCLRFGGYCPILLGWKGYNILFKVPIRWTCCGKEVVGTFQEAMKIKGCMSK